MQYPDRSRFLVPCLGRQVPRAQFWIFVCQLPPSLHSARRQHVQSVHWIETNGVVPPPQSPPPDLKNNSRAYLCCAKGVMLDTKGMASTRQILPPRNLGHPVRIEATLEDLILLLALCWPDDLLHLESPSVLLPLLQTPTIRPVWAATGVQGRMLVEISGRAPQATQEAT
jgi:hypothetical protein